MRESIGGISLFQIVIVFLLIFTAIMCFTINHSRAFAVKDEVISIIEGTETPDINGTLSDATIAKIFDRLGEVGYRVTGTCPSDYSSYRRANNSNGFNQVDTSQDANICIKRVNVPQEFKKQIQAQCQNGIRCTVLGGGEDGGGSFVYDYPIMYYYNVMLFYKLDVPVLKKFDFKINSSTRVIFVSNDRTNRP